MSLLVDLIDNDKSRKRWFWHLFKKSFVAFSVFYFFAQTIRHFLDGLALSTLWLGNTWFYEISQDKEALSVSTNNLDFWQNFHGAETWMAEALTSTGVFVLQFSQPMMVYSNNQVLWASLAVACLFAVYQLFLFARYVMSSIEQEHLEYMAIQDVQNPIAESEPEEESQEEGVVTEDSGNEASSSESEMEAPIHPQMKDPISRLKSEESNPIANEQEEIINHEPEEGEDEPELEQEEIEPEPDEIDGIEDETDEGSGDPGSGVADFESLYDRFMGEDEDDFLDDDDDKNSNNKEEEQK